MTLLLKHKSVWPALSSRVNIKCVYKVTALLGFLCVIGALNQCQSSKLDENLQAAKTWDVHAQRVHAIDKWNLEAKIGFISEQIVAGKTKKKALNATVFWLQDSDRFEVTISGPLGFGRVSIEYDEQGARFTDKEGRIMRAENPEDLFLQQTGMYFPWQSLVWWIRGLPVPNVAHEKTLLKGGVELQNLVQSNWRVDYSNYQSPQTFVGQSLSKRLPSLPHKILFTQIATSDTETSALKLSAKIIIRDWDVTPVQ